MLTFVHLFLHYKKKTLLNAYTADHKWPMTFPLNASFICLPSSTPPSSFSSVVLHVLWFGRHRAPSSGMPVCLAWWCHPSWWLWWHSGGVYGGSSRSPDAIFSSFNTSWSECIHNVCVSVCVCALLGHSACQWAPTLSHSLSFCHMFSFLCHCLSLSLFICLTHVSRARFALCLHFMPFKPFTRTKTT